MHAAGHVPPGVLLALVCAKQLALELRRHVVVWLKQPAEPQQNNSVSAQFGIVQYSTVRLP